MRRPVDMLQNNIPVDGDYILAALFHFREKFKRAMKTPMVLNQVSDASLRAAESTLTTTTEDYAWYRISSINLDTDSQVNKNMARFGYGQVLDDELNNAIGTIHLYNAKLQLECHFICGDLKDLLSFVTRMLIMVAGRHFDYELSLSGQTWNVSPIFDTDFSIPDMDRESETLPRRFDLSFNCTIATKIGFIKPVPKINNAGELTINVEAT